MEQQSTKARMSFTFTLDTCYSTTFTSILPSHFTIYEIPVSVFMYLARCRSRSLQRFNCWVLQFIPSGFSHKLFPVFLFLLGIVMGFASNWSCLDCHVPRKACDLLSRDIFGNVVCVCVILTLYYLLDMIRMEGVLTSRTRVALD